MKEKELIALQLQMQQKMIQQLDQGINYSDQELYEKIEEYVLQIELKEYLPIQQKQELVKGIFNAIRRLDVLEDILEDEEITEIMINGPNHIFIEKRGKLIETNRRFQSKEKLEDVIQQIVSKVNRVVNESTPIVDVRLLDGSRVNVVLPPIALNGPIVTIRRFPKEPFHMDKLIEIGSITQEVADYLKLLVESGYNIFISGGTGSGKTTFLNALSAYIPSDERLITIEDSAELQIQNVPNLVRMETRNANVEGKNEITIRSLVKAALRQRPDRIIIGEVRDAAVIELLNAMNTGHDGSISTGHANSPMDMLHRLETLFLTGMDIPLEAVRNQIASAIDIVIQLGRLRDRSRKVLEIVEIEGVQSGDICYRSLFRFVESREKTEEFLLENKVIGRLEFTGKKLHHREKILFSGKEKELERIEASQDTKNRG